MYSREGYLYDGGSIGAVDPVVYQATAAPRLTDQWRGPKERQAKLALVRGLVAGKAPGIALARFTVAR